MPLKTKRSILQAIHVSANKFGHHLTRCQKVIISKHILVTHERCVPTIPTKTVSTPALDGRSEFNMCQT